MRALDNTPYLSQANFVGQGFDIWGQFDVVASVITPLFDPGKAGTHNFEFLDKTWALPDYVSGAEDTGAYFTEDTGSSREDFQSSLAVNASVNASYGAFSGQMSASYGKQFSTSSEHFYSYRNFFSSLAKLQLVPSNNYYSTAFAQRLAALPNEVTPANRDLFIDFFDDFGTYYTSSIVLGATLQYYVAVSKSSSITENDISASVNIEVKALFASGGVSVDTKFKETWKSYSANRTVNIIAKGGDPMFLGQIANADPDQPSGKTVELYNDWLASIKTNPAVVDFKLTGIWELCGDKSATVLKAFNEYAQTMRPKLSIDCSALPGIYPEIILAGQTIVPKNQPGDRGYQLVVLDRTNISATGIVLNNYYNFPANSGYPGFKAMYEAMAADIASGGYGKPSFVMILASYNMYNNAPPVPGIVPLLRSAGAGTRLEYWLDNSDAGSTITGNAVYIQVGIFGIGPNSGVSHFSSAWESPATGTLVIYFYKMPGSPLYTLSGAAAET
jgi:hypothetical protein